MSGHSKWATIKHKKGAADARRGQLFTKLIREVTVAAKNGGGDPNANPRLRLAMDKAREANMPKDNVEKAIKRGTGELEGVIYEEVTYEAYASGGVALYIEALTDNKNRTTAEVRNILTKRNGNMAGAGATAWLFQKKGYILVDKAVIDEEKLMNTVLEAGADDLKSDGTSYEITTDPKNFEPVKQALSAAKIPVLSADLTMLPTTTVRVEEESSAKQVLGLVELLEEHDDVNHVYANFDIPDELLSRVA
ncbi:MAG: YebC/PmpR family DNA-binding transcriptional regulator [Candidatus Omnitrophica bacterium]|nr:YebC/PmpR family DNA-binding transcriptional regulator [Candidatus Omnitrophota bacterium]